MQGYLLTSYHVKNMYSNNYMESQFLETLVFKEATGSLRN